MEGTDDERGRVVGKEVSTGAELKAREAAAVVTALQKKVKFAA